MSINNDFEKLINEVDEETVIPYDKAEKHDKIVKNEFKINNKLNLRINDIELDVLFLSTILFTLIKFAYTKEVLITKLVKNTDNEFTKTIIAKNINTNINVKDYLNEINQVITKTNEFESYFTELTRTNDLYFPDFQYYYQKDDGTDLNIPESNFTIIIKENVSKIQFVYNSARYSEKLMELFYNSLITIINKFINNQNILLKNISIAESHEFKFKKTNLKSLKEVFENNAKNHHDKLALIASDKTLTYDELNQESNKIANSLIDNGLNIGDRVIINLNRDSNLIISIIAVIKAGGALILTNPNDPVERNNYFKENSKAKIIINQNNINTLNKNTNTNNPITDLNLNNLLAIIYTSGSTGKPKGVMLTHENMANRMFYSKENILSYDIINLHTCNNLLNANVLFVGFLMNFFVLLSTYRTIVLSDDKVNTNPIKLYELFKKTQFDSIATVPSAIEAYLKIEPLKEVISNLKMLMLVGEKSTDKFIDNLKKHTKSNIYAMYGSTEGTGISNIKLLNDDVNNVGKPQYNVDEKIMDLDGNPIPVGMIGELWIGGPSTSKGYINNPQLTKKSFTKINDYNYFKSGDFAKFNINGEVEIIGRIDNQVKLRGQRIELGEIEKNVAENMGIEKVVVTIQEINKEQYLTLYFTSAEEVKDENIDKIKEKIKNGLLEKLPIFMIPQFYIHLKEFPLTQTGKINIKKLPEPEFKLDEIESPKTDNEIKIFEFCSEILGYDDFGVTNSLVSIGFTSLSIITLSTKILKKYNVQLNLTIFEDVNIQSIAKMISKSPKFKHKSKYKNFYPLATNQMMYYNMFINGRNPNSLFVNTPINVKFNKISDAFKLKDALIKNIELNPHIKFKLLKVKDKIYQKEDLDSKIDIKINNQELTDKIKKDFVKPFDLFKGQLFRFAIYYHNNKINLLMDIYHILTDVYSNEVFLNDLVKLYNGEKIVKNVTYYDYYLESSSLQKIDENNDFIDGINEDNDFINGINGNNNITKVNEEYNNRNKENDFYNQLKNFPMKDYINQFPESNSHELKIEHTVFNIEVIDKLSKKLNITISTLFLTLISLSFSKVTGLKKILINLTHSGRNDPKYSDVFGYITNTTPIILEINEKWNLKNYLSYLNKSLHLAIEDHLSFNIEKFHKASANIFQLSFNITSYNQNKDYSIEIIEKKVSPDDLDNIFKGISMVLFDVSTESVLQIIYDDNAYEKVKSFINNIYYILDSIIKNPSIDLNKILK